MRFILLLLLIVVITPISEYFLPWWMIAVVPFLLSAIMNLKGGVSFIAGFTGIAAFWFIAALIKDIPNDHLLSHRMAELFHLTDYALLIFVISFLGGMIGGLAAWAGALVRVKK